jgi:hypothetical protein
MQSSKQNQQLTPVRVTDLMQWLVGETRGMLAKARLRDYKIDHASDAAEENKEYHVCARKNSEIELDRLRGYCGHAQSFMNWALQDIGYAPKSFTVNQGDPHHAPTLPGAAWNHVALSVEIATTEGVKKFLLDPTYKQFCTGDKDAPATLLENAPDGEHIVETLLDKGFIELTPQIASSYVTAFCKGISPFSSQQAALDFLGTSDQGRLDAGLWPPKNFFDNNGWKAPRPPAPKP